MSGFTELFIRRPVATVLVMSGITLFGLIAYRALPVSDLPNIDMPTLVVTANLPGANPETMASAVATPLERQFSTIDGLDSMSSVNRLGSTTVTLQFALERSLDGAAQDVQAAIAQAAPLLPPGMPTPPSFRRVNPADQPVLYLAIRSNTLPLYKVHQYAEVHIAQRFSMVQGVAQVQILGAQKYAVRVQVNPEKLAARRIGIDEVEAAIRRHNVNIPTGALYGLDQLTTIQATGQLIDAAAYRDVVVAHRNGAQVRLGDVATVLDSVEDDKTVAWLSGPDFTERFMNVTVYKQPGANAVEVADRVRALVPSIAAQLPPTVTVQVIADRANTIRDSFRDVQFTMLLTFGLVVLVVFLFLRNVSATVIPSLALPISVIGTFSVMHLCGFSLNNLSMMALILAIGFVVDDAIVVLENIVRHMERGTPPFEAAIVGSREVSFTILSMTVSLAAVFIPLLFLDGILGRLFDEFAITIVVAILVSGFVSVTLTPMLCSRFITPGAHDQGWFFRATERVFTAAEHAYEVSLRWTLRHGLAVLMLSFGVLGATVWLFIALPKGFVPSEDRNEILSVVEFPQGTSHHEIQRQMQALIDAVRDDTAVETYSTTVGGGSSDANFGRIFFDLLPRDERPGRPTVDEVIARIRPKFDSVIAGRAFLQNPPAIRIGGALTKSLYQYTLQGGDNEQLYRSSQELLAEIERIPGLTDVASDLQIKSPEVNVVIDRDRAAALRVTPEQIESALFSAYGPRWVSTIYAPDNQYRVLLELDRSFHEDPSRMTSLYVRSLEGRLVPIDALVSFESRVGPSTINHYGQLAAVTLSFNLAPGVSLGEAVARIEETALRVLPDTVSATFQGTAEAFQKSTRNLALLLMAALLVVYIVLGVLYESFVHPLTILSGLPSAGFGALLTLWAFDLDLNIYSFVGLILLIGIVKKNAIMQIDFALEAERKGGLTPREAIFQGCLTRFRPIMMTTGAALFGALPIALGHGAGGEARRPLGLCVVGGLLFSQLVTLYLTPIVYLYLGRLERRQASAPEYAVEPGAVPSSPAP
jgi:hydrophobic/amphiphilic exporter-1 (mainly G- bacteria), HAE1 family